MSGAWGEFRVGRQKKPEYQFLNPETDPVGAQSIASPMNNFSAETQRSNNAITYLSPEFYGVSAQFSVALRDSTTKPTNGLQQYNIVTRYENGPFRAAAGWEQQDAATGTSAQKILRLLASYELGAARFYLVYQGERQTDNSENVHIYEAAASYRFSPFQQLALLYGFANDRTGNGNNAQQFSLAYNYFLSKSTSMYVAAAFIQNRNKADYTLNGTGYQGVSVVPGFNARGAIIGMIHSF
jgi:predicted porin